ncbi:MAG: class I SAM-dependent methyltransferase [Thermoplasmata archaeon]|nr:class I SAM-dependent methyltransferase [Thermoplasmata archaeon]
MREPKEYYDSIGEKEWHRLAKDPYHMLEYEITMHFLKGHLPKEGRVLDAGGGPGRYSIELAKMGYEVVLLDISPIQLDIAKRKLGECEEEVRSRVTGIAEGSVTDLSEYNDESFDSVLCLGTLSHLIEEEDRKRAAKELVRVLKRDSPIFVSVIGRYSAFRVILRDLPGELTEPGHKDLFTDGVHHGHEIIKEDGRDYKRSTAFPDAYFFLPEEIPELFNECGVEALQLASCEGLSAHLEEATNALYEDKEKWEKWFQIVLNTCTEPSIVGMGEHILFVGRKK